MANQYTYKPITDKTTLEELYFNRNMTQLEIGHHFKVSQKIIHRLMKNLGVKSRVASKRDQLAEKNDSWKGDDAGYQALHIRVEVKFGKPKYCEVCKTSDLDKSYDWANLTGKYCDVTDYSRMCRSCHRQYDKNRKRVKAK